MGYTIINNLASIRLDMHFKTQREFAEFLGINYTDYSRFENNKKMVSAIQMFLIAQKVGKKVDDIFKLVKLD